MISSMDGQMQMEIVKGTLMGRWIFLQNGLKDTLVIVAEPVSMPSSRFAQLSCYLGVEDVKDNLATNDDYEPLDVRTWKENGVDLEIRCLLRVWICMACG